ncbi:MAG: phage tail protein [Desulfobulbaceae bacterium]|nr:phage tail protein [Desulfobulbaceae bacterium]
MEIRNEEHARNMLKEWQGLALSARKNEIRLAIESLELSSMYYEQKGNDKGAERAKRCVTILAEHFNTLE